MALSLVCVLCDENSQSLINPAQSGRRQNQGKGMGAEIQPKINATGLCSIWGLHKNAKNGVWSLYQEDRPQKDVQYFESILPWNLKLDGSLEYDKEKLKQTILKHESTFRHQLQELHRLYGKQKELMNVFRRRDPKKVRVEEEASTSSPFPSHISSEDPNCGWHVSHAPPMQLVFGQSSQSEFSYKQSLPGFCKENNMIPFSSRDDQSTNIWATPNSKGTLRRTSVIDLEIPADACMDTEATYLKETCRQLPMPERNYSTCTEKILLSKGVKTPSHNALTDHYNGDVSRSSLPLKRRSELADLNEPILFEATSVSGSADIPVDLTSSWGNIKSEDKSPSGSADNPVDLTSYWGNMKSEDKYPTPNSVLNPTWKDSFPSSKRNNIGGGCSISFQSMNEMGRKEQPTCGFKPNLMQPHSLSMSRDANSRDSSLAFQLSKDEPKNLNEISASEQGRTGNRTKRKLFGVDIFEVKDKSLVTGTAMVHPGDKLDELGSMLSSFHVISGADSRTKSVQSSKGGVSNQNGSSLYSQLNAKHSQGNPLANWNFINNTITFEFVPKESASVDHVKSVVSVEHLDSDRKPAIVAKIASKTSNGFQDVFAAEYNILPADCQSKQKCLKEFLIQRTENIHLAEKSRESKNYHHLNLDSLQNCSQQFFQSSSSLPSEKLSRKLEKASPVLINDIVDSDTEVNLPSSTRMIRDFPTSSKQRISRDLDLASKSSELTCSTDNGHHPTDISIEKVVSGHHLGGKCLNLEKPVKNIDLNLSLVEEEAPSSPCLPTAVVKLGITQVDLEVPTVPESEADQQIEVSLDSPKEPCEELSRLAAEALVAISVCVGEDTVADTTHEPVKDRPNECLQWFVDVVVSSFDCHELDNTNDVKANGNDGFTTELIPNGMDYFEYMTLKLEDTKVEDCYHSYLAPIVEENQEDDEAKVTTLSRRPRRGQARRGRLRKDFQRDILPSLISLSKLEVTEDLQTFEELLKASGTPWQSSLSRRSSAKSSRGRRRAGVIPHSSQVVEPAWSHPEQKGVTREVQPEDKTLIGWGKRTRRLPRQRCVAGTSIL